MITRMLSLLAMGFLVSGCSVSESGSASVADAVEAPASERSADKAGPDKKARDGDGGEIATTAKGDTPPLYVFYVIHGHQQGEHLPYSDTNMSRLDKGKAENFATAIKRISDTTSAYGMPISWELVAGTAKGIRELQGEDNIFKRLMAQGHEIGIHTHDASRIRSTVEAVNQSLGILVTTGSGLQMEAINSGASGAQKAMSKGIAEMVDLGLTTASIGLVDSGRSPISEVCNNSFGEGNDMVGTTGHILFPYKPDYKNDNVCRHNPDSDFVFVNTPGPKWLVSGARKGMLSDQNFDYLRKSLDASLEYMDERKPERVAVWGFTTHISEYCQGSQGGPVLDSSIKALDDWMKYLSDLEKQGKVEFITVGEISKKI